MLFVKLKALAQYTVHHPLMNEKYMKNLKGKDSVYFTIKT